MRVVSIRLSEKVRCEQRVEGREEMSPIDIWDKNVTDSHCKALRQAEACGVSEEQGGQCHQWSRAGGKMSQRYQEAS